MVLKIPTLEDIYAAESRIRRFIEPTLLTYSPTLSDKYGRKVYLKWDNKFRTGSFKERGALNFLLTLSPEERKRGVIAASAGNHALALSYYSALLKIPCTIVMPKSAPVVKVRFTQEFGADVILEGLLFHEALSHALKLSRKHKKVMVHAYDDPRVIAGQGTAALEILEQMPEIDAIVSPIGGGGLISGIGIAAKSIKPSIKVIGVRSDWAVNARAHLKQKKQIALPPTSIADGIAIKTPGKLTEKIIKKVVDQQIVASENEIAHAVVEYLEYEKMMVEGAGAAGLVSLATNKLSNKIKSLAIMVCGSNIDVNMVGRLIARELGETGRMVRLRVSVPDRPGSLAKVASIFGETGAQIFQTNHDRILCRSPGAVLITFILEVRDEAHLKTVKKALDDVGIEVHEN